MRVRGMDLGRLPKVRLAGPRVCVTRSSDGRREYERATLTVPVRRSRCT